VVRMPDGRIAIDPTGRLAGRGAYLCDDIACRRGALQRGALGRALSAPVPEEVRAMLLGGTEPMLTTNDEGGARGQE